MQSSSHHHETHAGHSVAMFRDKFWISLVLTIPTLLWGHMLQSALGYRAPAFTGSGYLPALFGVAVFLYGGTPFLQGAVRELRDRVPGMMTLISLAITVAFAFSIAVTLGYAGMSLWDELSTLVVIMLLGHWIEMRSISQAQGALQELAKLLPAEALRVSGEEIEKIPLSSVNEGDVVLVTPGASVPADGIVRQGVSAVDESMLTGESRPVEKKEGDKVIAATINGNGSLRVEVTGTGERTALAGITRLVAQAQSSRSRAQALADRAAFILTLVAIASAIVTLVAWLALGATAAYAIERVVTVLVIACPHALGLAIPLVIAISTTLGARAGLLVRDRRGLEEARKLDIVVFDKTGTLTRGEFRVVELVTDGSLSDIDALSLAAAVERDSEHTIARGIVKSAEERNARIAAVRDFRAMPGRGVEARLDGRVISVGGPALLAQIGAQPSPALVEAATRAANRGQATVYLVSEGAVRAMFAVADAVREESRVAVQRLHDQKITVVMLTGDARAVAAAVARELAIDVVFAEVLPEQKVEKIDELKRSGKRVAMVGDGVNDAPALVSADVGIAIGAGTEVAVEAGDVVLIRSDPRDVSRLIALSRASYRKMLQNLWWAVGYNVIAIPLAAGVLEPWGFVLSPAAGAVLMSVSTVIVAVNAQLLRLENA
ncbi:MAG TPA: heavy metal translocating P-type ATPase [Gemmatimonadaceae bacterium]|nr:heavy metal translocating P-type ATPase [Gemmatimonadaceae bacterium]